MPDQIIRNPRVEELTGLSDTTRYRLERKGLFPRRLKLSRNAVGWYLSEVLAWVEERERGGCPPPAAAISKRAELRAQRANAEGMSGPGSPMAAKSGER